LTRDENVTAEVTDAKHVEFTSRRPRGWLWRQRDSTGQQFALASGSTKASYWKTGVVGLRKKSRTERFLSCSVITQRSALIRVPSSSHNALDGKPHKYKC
jgi:hypothetical protein